MNPPHRDPGCKKCTITHEWSLGWCGLLGWGGGGDWCVVWRSLGVRKGLKYPGNSGEKTGNIVCIYISSSLWASAGVRGGRDTNRNIRLKEGKQNL